jgi:hypothetical protein
MARSYGQGRTNEQMNIGTYEYMKGRLRGLYFPEKTQGLLRKSSPPLQAFGAFSQKELWKRVSTSTKG